MQCFFGEEMNNDFSEKVLSPKIARDSHILPGWSVFLEQISVLVSVAETQLQQASNEDAQEIP